MKKAVDMLQGLCGFALIVIAAQLLAYHYGFIVYPFPNEYREGAMLTTTAGLVRGVNPFDLQNQPQYMNDYGIFYSLVTYPFAKVFGVTMLVHRSVTAFFIFACGGVMLWVMRRLKAAWLPTAAAVVIFYGCCLFRATTTPMANPSSLGVFLFLSALLVPWSRGFSYRTLLLSAALGILGYYTKPYFLLSVPMLAAYLFVFVSKRKAAAYLLAFAGMAYGSILFVHHQWNCYFANCFFLHTNPGWMSWGQSVRQFKEYVSINNMVLLTSFVALGYQAFRSREASWKAIRGCCFLKGPWSMSFILYCTLCCLVVLVFWLGKHEEAYLWYYFHLLSPFLLICMAVTLSRQWSWAVFLAPLLVWNCWTVSRNPLAVKLDRNDPDWSHAAQLIASHKDILNTPLIAPLLVERGLPVYDNGLSEYFKKGAYRDSDLIRHFSKGDPRIIMRHYAFLNEVKEKIKARAFDLVMIVYDYAPLVPGELTGFYHPVGQIMLPVPALGTSWRVIVWVPNDR
ncbi:MAG: hypothetical protein WCO69_02890 [Candidatus Omnitrophota bacterium]